MITKRSKGYVLSLYTNKVQKYNLSMLKTKWGGD